MKTTILILYVGNGFLTARAQLITFILFVLEIYYIERDGKNARIVTQSGESKVRKSLQQVYDELASEEFIFVERGCIVNMIHIVQIKDGMAILKNGDNCAISRSHLQPVKEQINAYWGAHI